MKRIAAIGVVIVAIGAAAFVVRSQQSIAAKPDQPEIRRLLKELGR